MNEFRFAWIFITSNALSLKISKMKNRGNKSNEPKQKDLIDCFLTQIRSIELPENTTIEQLLEDDFKKFKLAEKVLLENPILLEADCSGRGLPSQRYAYYSHLHGFKMWGKGANPVLSKRVIKGL